MTFFFNGGVEKQFEGEDRSLVPSPKVATYDLMPEMNCAGVADEVNQFHNHAQLRKVNHSGGLCLNRTNGKDSRVRLRTNFLSITCCAIKGKEIV